MSRRFSSRMTSSPTWPETISLSPLLSNFSSILWIAVSTASAETGRLRRASMRLARSLADSYSERLPFFLTMTGIVNSILS